MYHEIYACFLHRCLLLMRGVVVWDLEVVVLKLPRLSEWEVWLQEEEILEFRLQMEYSKWLLGEANDHFFLTLLHFLLLSSFTVVAVFSSFYLYALFQVFLFIKLLLVWWGRSATGTNNFMSFSRHPVMSMEDITGDVISHLLSYIYATETMQLQFKCCKNHPVL